MKSVRASASQTPSAAALPPPRSLHVGATVPVQLFQGRVRVLVLGVQLQRPPIRSFRVVAPQRRAIDEPEAVPPVNAARIGADQVAEDAARLLQLALPGKREAEADARPAVRWLPDEHLLIQLDGSVQIAMPRERGRELDRRLR